MREVTIRFDNDEDAEAFIRGIENGHIDGYRLYTLKGSIEIVGESS